MSVISETLVQVNNVVLSWDGLRHPETRQSGSVSYNISVLLSNTAPELPELKRIVDAKLVSGMFKGTLPPGGNWPLDNLANKDVNAPKFGPQYNGWFQIKAGTTRGIPPIIDANLQPLQPMVFGPMLYPGCIMNVLVDVWDYNNIEKGLSFGLQGIQIVDATAPTLPVAAGMSPDEVAGAFRGQPPAGAPGAGVVPAAPGPPGAGPPAPDAPAAHVMLPAAGTYTYDQYIANGWTDEKLILSGYMQA